MNNRKSICNWTKCFCTIACILFFTACAENEQYLTMESEIASDKVIFVDVKSEKTLTYDKLVVNDNAINEIAYVRAGISPTNRIRISWWEGNPPLTLKKFQRIIDLNELENKMKYTLTDGILTIYIPFSQNEEKEEVIIKKGQLFKGNANFENIQRFEVSFLLSEDKSEIYDLKIIITELEVTARYHNMEIKSGVGSQTTTFIQPYPVKDNKVNVSLGKNGNLSFEFSNNNATGTIAYTYIISGQSGQNSYPDIPVDLGRKPISFRAQ